MPVALAMSQVWARSASETASLTPDASIAEFMAVFFTLLAALATGAAVDVAGNNAFAQPMPAHANDQNAPKANSQCFSYHATLPFRPMGGLHVATYGQDAVGDAVIRRLRCEDAAVRRLLDAKVTRTRAAGA